MALVEKYCSALASGGGNGSSGNPWTISEALANAVAGNRVTLKADGTYTITTNTSIIGAGTFGSPIIFRAENYANITHNVDGTLNPTNLVTINITSGQRLTLGTAFLDFEGINFVGAYSAASPTVFSGTKPGIKNCRFETTTNGSAYAFQATSAMKPIGCDFVCSSTGTNSRVVQITVSGVAFDRCTFKANGSTVTALLDISSDYSSVSNCIFFPSAGVGISLGAAIADNVKIENCTITGQAVAAIQSGNYAITTQSIYVENSIITDNSYAFKSLYSATANHNFISIKNMIGRNTNFDLGFGDCPHDLLITPSVSTSGDFVNYASGDFRLVATSPACKAGLCGEDLGGLKRVYPTLALAANVRNTIDRGDGTTGTLVVPNASDVRRNTTFDNGTTGSLDVPSIPLINDVRNSIQYGISNDHTGTLIVPLASNVKRNTVYDNGTQGTLDVPSIPSANDVRLNVQYGISNDHTGTIVLPTASQVLDTIAFGSNGTELTGNVTLPNISDVRLNTMFGPNSLLSGSLVTVTQTIPQAKDVRLGVTYGSASSLLTGLLTKSNYDYPMPIYTGNEIPEKIILSGSIQTTLILNGD